MPEAPAWLRKAFADGVDEAELATFDGRPPVAMVSTAYAGAHPNCWLASFDDRRRPCEGKLERFHFIGRQRVRNLLWDALLYAVYTETGEIFETRETIMLAEWDARNGGIACEHHHRRFDSHACSPKAPKIVVPYEALPSRVVHFAFDTMNGAGLDKFPSSI